MIAIVSTVRTPGAEPLRSWISYHRALGFDRMYLFFDPGDPGADEAAAHEGVEVVIVDEGHLARLAEHPYAKRFAPLLAASGGRGTSPDGLTSLQLCNMADGLDRARRDGASWLLHIDVDELFFTGGATATSHFAQLDALGIAQARYINHEAVGERDEHDDYFAEMTLFKRNPAEVPREVLTSQRAFWEARGGYFLAYANGKCAARVLDGVTPETAHGFRLPTVAMGRCSLSRPSILHYPYTSFRRFWDKHARLGDFRGDTLLGQRWDPPSFLLSARDGVARGHEDEARRLYRGAALLLDPARVDELVRADVLLRIEGPARAIAGSQ